MLLQCSDSKREPVDLILKPWHIACRMPLTQHDWVTDCAEMLSEVLMHWKPLAFRFHLRWRIDTAVPRHFQAHPLDTKASYYTRIQLGTCTTLSFLGSSVSGNGQMAFSEKSCLAAVQCCSVTQNSFRIAFVWYVKSIIVDQRLLMAIHCWDSFRAKSTILFFQGSHWVVQSFWTGFKALGPLGCQIPFQNPFLHDVGPISWCNWETGIYLTVTN